MPSILWTQFKASHQILSVSNFIEVHEKICHKMEKLKKASNQHTIMLVGDSCSGKSQLMHSYAEERPVRWNEPTVGISYKIKRVHSKVTG